MKRKRRELDVGGVSFLDCICCGFGAVVLLLVIVKVHDPVLNQQQREQMAAASTQYRDRLTEIAEQARDLESELERAREEEVQSRSQAIAMNEVLSSTEDRLKRTETEAEVLATIRESARRAEQDLLSEIARQRRHR